MSTTNQVIAADAALSTALEEYTNACYTSRPRVFKGMSFAMEEAVSDVKENAKQSLWQKFKAWVNRIIDWFMSRLKKKEEHKKTEEDEFNKKFRQTMDKWEENLDETMEALRKVQETAAKSAADKMNNAAKAGEQYKHEQDAVYKRAFEKIRASISADLVELYNQELLKYKGIGTALNQKTFTSSSLSSITTLPIVSEAYAELRKAIATIKSLASLMKSDRGNTDKLHELMRSLENRKLADVIEKFKGENNTIQITDVLTIQAIESLGNNVKAQFKALSNNNPTAEFQEALTAVRQGLSDNNALSENDEAFSAHVKEMQTAISSLVGNVGREFFSLELLTSTIHGEVIDLGLFALRVVNTVVSKYEDQYKKIVAGEDKASANMLTHLHLKFAVQDMLAGAK